MIWFVPFIKYSDHIKSRPRWPAIPTGKRPLERPRHRWEDNVRMDLKYIGINMKNWVDLAQDRDYWRAFVNAAFTRALQ